MGNPMGLKSLRTVFDGIHPRGPEDGNLDEYPRISKVSKINLDILGVSIL